MFTRKRVDSMELKTFMTKFILRRTSEECRHSPEDLRSLTYWTNTFTGLEGRLDKVVASSEGRFLSLVEKLQDYYRRAQEMCVRSSEMVELMTGEGLKKATEGLSMILDELRQNLENPDHSTARTSKVFNGHLDAIKKLTSYLDDFNMLVMNLSMLGFLTQVENAYIYTHTTGFASLTDDVRSLAGNIKAKAGHIRSKSESVESYLIDALSKISTFEKNQSEQDRLVLSKAFENQRSLERKHSTSSGTAKRIDAGTQKIASSIGDIVMSLQFHDITRQQIEHVKEVLSTVSTKIHENGHAMAEKAIFVREVCSLQAAQLGQSRDELTDAVLKIIRNLDDISRSVGGILKEAHEAAMASETSESTFMEELDQGISSVIQSMRLASSEQAKLSDTVRSASDMASEMSVFVKDIEALGLNLQLIALNARIKAAHLGHEGAALDTISGSIYELSKNARDETGNLSDMLENLVNLSSAFHNEFNEMQDDQTRVTDLLVEKLRNLITSLHEINTSIITMLTELTGMGESLMRDLEDAASHTAVHKEIQIMIDDVIETLSEVTKDAGRENPAAHIDTASSFFTEIDKLYTMESEREIHLRHLAGAQEQDQAGAQSTTGDLGDNVELF